MAEMSDLRGAVLGKGYRLDRRVDSRDGDDSVFEATHERIPGHFVIRLFPTETLLQPESSSRIQRSARVASLLRTPHAIQTLDFSASGETPAFVVTERVPGRLLSAVLADEGRLPFPRAMDIVESIATALIAGHEMGLVHGDVRPALVLLPDSRAPLAKLGGFGWGKEWRAAARMPAPSSCLAPEQRYGKVLTVDERVDQFGLAALAYQLIAGNPPFSEDSADLAQMLGGLRPPMAIAELVPGVPRPLDEVLRRALSSGPSDRFTNVRHLVSELSAIRSSVETRSRATTPAQGLPGLVAAATPLGALPKAPRGLETSAPSSAAGEPAGADDGPTEDIEIEEVSDDVKLALGPGSVARPEPGVRPSSASLSLADRDVRTDVLRARSPGEATFADRAGDLGRRDAAGGTPRRGLPTGRPPPRAADQQVGESSSRAVVEASPDASGSGESRASNGSSRSPVAPSTLAASRLSSFSRLRKSTPVVALVVGAAVAVAAGSLLFRLGRREPTVAESVTSPSQPSHRVVAIAGGTPAAPAPASAPRSAPAAGSSAPPSSVGGPSPGEVAGRPTVEPAATEANEPKAVRGPIIATRSVTPHPSPAPGVRPLAATAPAPSQAQAALARAAGHRAAHPAGLASARVPAPGSDLAVPRAAATPPASCMVRIVSKPWAQVWIDGKNTGKHTPVDGLKVPCGTRKLELKRPDKGIEQMEMLNIVPGQVYQGHYELE